MVRRSTAYAIASGSESAQSTDAPNSPLRAGSGVLWLIFAATGEREALLADVLLAALAWTHRRAVAS
jgi:hypothetical protein